MKALEEGRREFEIELQIKTGINKDGKTHLTTCFKLDDVNTNVSINRQILTTLHASFIFFKMSRHDKLILNVSANICLGNTSG
jgi:hypothetical protein